ncbi:MAG: YwmB family TATA-box binding protein [Firmicutes bacterium]|nr:YwmB family TATA-box binding protein [Alicyclobacillaceae bacterium]MCL6497706.1 YwmB family TATA-box binding protein [Bacillota bacterium]
MRLWIWLLAIAALLWVGSRAGQDPVGPLDQALSAAGANPAGWSLNAWVALAHPLSVEDLGATVGRLAAALHVTAPVRVVRGIGYDRAWVEGAEGTWPTEVMAERLSSGATFLVVNRSGTGGLTGLSSSEYLIRRQLSAWGAVHVAVTVEGLVHGQPWSPATKQAVVRRMLERVGAQAETPWSESAAVAVAAYTPQIARSERLDGRRVNLQVAVTYDRWLEANRVYVGSPLITVSY